MSMFEQKGNALIARYNGEIVQVEPWGENSLRVRAVKMGSILDTDYAPAPSRPQHTGHSRGGKRRHHPKRETARCAHPE